MVTIIFLYSSFLSRKDYDKDKDRRKQRLQIDVRDGTQRVLDRGVRVFFKGESIFIHRLNTINLSLIEIYYSKDSFLN